MSAPDLPILACTEDAIRFGQYITRDQFLVLHGARAALQREFDSLDANIIGARGKLNQQIVLATKIQLCREALESAPDLILASLIS